MVSLICFLLLTITYSPEPAPYILVCGVAQDAGYPQSGCKKSCCIDVWEDPEMEAWVASIAIVNPVDSSFYLIDATPDFAKQVHYIEERTQCTLKGIFLTHAHIGHYTGLVELGREVMGSDQIPVYALPRMKTFLETNGPWSQLVHLKNIVIHPLTDKGSIPLFEGLNITPYQVPHRDEYSETAGFHIQSKEKSGWYIPDIDKWEKWDHDLRKDQEDTFFLLDGTFYRNGEIWGRDMSQIPHPFISESISYFSDLSPDVKNKIIFTHFNHTNPVLYDSRIREEVLAKGHRLAFRGMVIPL